MAHLGEKYQVYVDLESRMADKTTYLRERDFKGDHLVQRTLPDFVLDGVRRYLHCTVHDPERACIQIGYIVRCFALATEKGSLPEDVRQSVVESLDIAREGMRLLFERSLPSELETLYTQHYRSAHI